MKPTYQATFRLGLDHMTALAEAAKRTGKSKNSLVCEAIAAFVERIRQADQAPKR